LTQILTPKKNRTLNNILNGGGGQRDSRIIKTTTQRVYKNDMVTINEWLKRLDMTFAEFVHALIIHVDGHKKAELYNRLTPIVVGPPKELSGCKIDKSRKCIQKTGTYFR